MARNNHPGQAIQKLRAIVQQRLVADDTLPVGGCDYVVGGQHYCDYLTKDECDQLGGDWDPNRICPP